MSDFASFSVEEIQRELLSLLAKFHRLCCANGIRYSLHAGTLLGAVREKGFIPWDDDADVSIMRSEYERLKAVMKDKDYHGDLKLDDYSDRVPKIVIQTNKKPVVWIDIFIYDYISERRICQQLKMFVLTFFIMFSKSRKWMKAVKASGNCSGLKYLCYSFISLLGSLFPLATRIRWMNWFCENCFVGKKKYIHRGLDQHRAIGLILPSDTMAEYKLTEFAGEELMVSTRCHDILLSSYGSDYMTPKKEVNAGHDAARDALSLSI